MQRRILFLAALFFGLATAAKAVPTYNSDMFQFTGTPGNTTITAAFTPGAGTNRIMFVSVRYNGAANSVPMVVYNGVPMTLTLTTIVTGSANVSSYLYYRVGPTGPSNISVTAGGHFGGPLIVSAWTLSGVNQTTPINQVVAASTTGRTVVLNFTPANANNAFTTLNAGNVGGNTALTTYSVNNGNTNFSDSTQQINSNKHSFGLAYYAPGSTAATSITHSWAAGSTGFPILGQAVELIGVVINTPTFTPTPTISLTPSDSPTASPSPTDSATVTVSPTHTPTVTFTSTPSPSSTSTPAMPLLKSVNVSTADLGDTVTYSFNYLNDSGADADIHIWDTLPIGLGFVGCDNACVQNGSVVSWTISAVPAGTGGTVQFWAVVNGYPLLRWLKQQWAALWLRPSTAVDCGTAGS